MTVKHSLLLAAAFLLLASCSRTQTLEQAFLSPSEDAKPIMIWQWMDGLVTKEGITQDLEAYQKAGIGGVQQFLVGSETQILVKDTTNAIGTDIATMTVSVLDCSNTTLPFYTDFEALGSLGCWTAIDANNDGLTWDYEEDFGAINYSWDEESEEGITPGLVFERVPDGQTGALDAETRLDRDTRPGDGKERQNDPSAPGSGPPLGLL